MPNTKTSIAMMALYHLSQSKRITNIDSDTSKQAAVMRDFYRPALDRVFRDFDWPFALVVEDLDLVETQPSAEWAFSYRYPNDAQRLSRIVSGVWPETLESRVPYRILSDGSGRLIYTNKEDAVAEYVSVQTDVTTWTPDFVEAFAFLWAALAAPAITGGDQFKLGMRALQLYEASLNNTYLNTMNEEKPVPQAESSFITARD